MKGINTIGVGLLAAAALATAGTAQAEPISITYGEVLNGLCVQLDDSPTPQRVSDLVVGAATAGWPNQGISAMLHRAVDQVCVRNRGVVAYWQSLPPSAVPLGSASRAPNFPMFKPEWMGYMS